MDGEFLFALGGDGGVEELEDLGGEGFAGDGAHGVGGVVGEVPFVLVGAGAELEEGVVGEEVGGVDGGVVDVGDVDEVEDWGWMVSGMTVGMGGGRAYWCMRS